MDYFYKSVTLARLSVSSLRIQYCYYPSIKTTNIIKGHYLVVNRATCFGYFLAIFSPNKETELLGLKMAKK